MTLAQALVLTMQTQPQLVGLFLVAAAGACIWVTLREWSEVR